MSRIGKNPIAVPDGVKADINGAVVHVRGPKGELKLECIPGITVAQVEKNLVVARASDSATDRANHGLVRANLANLVRGVSQGFERKLEIQGVGYKAEVTGDELVLTIGFSHLIHYKIPKGIKIVVEKQVRIAVQGVDKQQVGQVAADLRAFRPPDSYKGKGLRYEGESVRIKAGKSAA